jgi:hypothetical protein
MVLGTTRAHPDGLRTESPDKLLVSLFAQQLSPRLRFSHEHSNGKSREESLLTVARSTVLPPGLSEA